MQRQSRALQVCLYECLVSWIFPLEYTKSMDNYLATRKKCSIIWLSSSRSVLNLVFYLIEWLFQHYKRDADGLCHRLVTPLVSDAFKLSCESANWEERQLEFRRTRVLIPRSEVQLGDVIGHGEFGGEFFCIECKWLEFLLDVLLGYYGSRKVAIKLLKNGMASDLLNEARFMVDLHHPHLVGLIGVVMDESRDVYMLTEYMANGNLVDFLRSRGRHQVERSQLLRFALNVADGMAYMESRHLVHRDLAARNILLDESFVAKISDFGLAQSITQPINDSVRGKFPIKWTAPEALRHSHFSNKSDVWSFGVLVWEIWSFGRVPYPRIVSSLAWIGYSILSKIIQNDHFQPIQDVVRHIEQGYRMEPPEGCPLQISQLMSDTWALDPLSRPTFAEIVLRLKRISAWTYKPQIPNIIIEIW